MFKFKETFPTPTECTKWVNTKQFIIVHHTGTKEWTIKWVLDGLYRRPDFASCHFVVDVNWESYKIGKPDDILWHAGVSSWGKLKDMNNYSLGIEVIWPMSNGSFTDSQRVEVRKLIQHLMAVFKIPKENVLRHRDIAPKRKTDIADTFWNATYKTWADYQNSLIPKEQ